MECWKNGFKAIDTTPPKQAQLRYFLLFHSIIPLFQSSTIPTVAPDSFLISGRTRKPPRRAVQSQVLWIWILYLSVANSKGFFKSSRVSMDLGPS
jgi:hypothetical protein